MTKIKALTVSVVLIASLGLTACGPSEDECRNYESVAPLQIERVSWPMPAAPPAPKPPPPAPKPAPPAPKPPAPKPAPQKQESKPKPAPAKPSAKSDSVKTMKPVQPQQRTAPLPPRQQTRTEVRYVPQPYPWYYFGLGYALSDRPDCVPEGTDF